MTEIDTTQHVFRVVRQLGHVASERAELATYLGFEAEAATQSGLARRYHQLAGQARHVFEACDLEAAAQTFPASTPAWSRPEAPKTPVLDTLARLSRGQREGDRCLICDSEITDAPNQLSAVIGHVQLFIHCDPAVCTEVLAARLSEECPF